MENCEKVWESEDNVWRFKNIRCDDDDFRIGFLLLLEIKCSEEYIENIQPCMQTNIWLLRSILGYQPCLYSLYDYKEGSHFAKDDRVKSKLKYSYKNHTGYHK